MTYTIPTRINHNEPDFFDKIKKPFYHLFDNSTIVEKYPERDFSIISLKALQVSQVAPFCDYDLLERKNV